MRAVMSMVLRSRSVAGLLTVALAVCVYVGCGKPPRRTGPAFWDSSEGKILALVKSQTFMNRRLNAASPSTFPYITDADVKVEHRGGGMFVVESYVEVPSAVGAKTRTHYICELKDTGTDSWTLIKLETK